MGELPPFASAWLRQREAGARAIATLEVNELRNLSAAQALFHADALLSATPIADVAGARRRTSGIVEQQRLFALSRSSRT